MKSLLHFQSLFIVAIVSMLFHSDLWAADQNRPEEAVAMVKKAIIYYKENGLEKTLQEVSKPRGQFVDKELFTVVLDQQGVVLAHGAFPKFIGRNIMEFRDPDGVEMVKEMFIITKAKGAGWVHYRFPNPITRVLEPKSTYVQAFDGLLFFCGVHTSEKKSQQIKKDSPSTK